MKKTELYGYVYAFPIDHDSTDVDDVLTIYEYLIKRHNIAIV